MVQVPSDAGTALEMLGLFAVCQDMIDEVADGHLRMSSPEVAKVLRDSITARSSDKDRARLLRAVVSDRKLDAPADRMVTVFLEAKSGRDRIAHGRDLAYGPSHLATVDIDTQTGRLRWMEQWLRWIGIDIGIYSVNVLLDDHPATPGKKAWYRIPKIPPPPADFDSAALDRYRLRATSYDRDSLVLFQVVPDDAGEQPAR